VTSNPTLLGVGQPADSVLPSPVVDITNLTRRFGEKTALDGVSLQVLPGEIHALLGPNGAGKTTLLRTLIGLVQPTSGTVEVLGRGHRALGARRGRVGLSLIPSGDRTFYLRLSGLENLIFFARLYGLRLSEAKASAIRVLAEVDLSDVARQPVSTYSHGMQKRLSVARAMLTQPQLLLVDESTHDLDPQNARRVQALVANAAAAGTAVVWATQRLDEIRGFANRVTVLGAGQVRFQGTVPQLQASALSRRYVMRLRVPEAGDAVARARELLTGSLLVDGESGQDAEHVVLHLPEHVVLGDVVTTLTRGGVQVLACREERSDIEAAFLVLTEPDPT
jgi:ABC-2 type transport system ATP-binding protein